MPPEPSPWDRKQERGSESSSSLGFRWRECHYGSSRDFSRCPDFPTRPPGHVKQGGWHLFPEEPGHGGYTPYRSGEEDNFQPSFSRGEGKYGRNSKESRGHRDLKDHSWEMNNGSPSLSGRLNDVNNDHRTVDDMLSYPTANPPHSGFVNTLDLHLKDHCENIKTGGINGLAMGQRGDRENSLDWKPLKWTRSGSFSSRGSGFSHSSSSKSLGAVDSDEGKTELLHPKNVNASPVQSPTGDAAACVTSAAPSEENISRKKPRLGWGEGLAKYEKKKVEDPDLCVNKDGPVVSPNNAELVNSQGLSLAEKSPRVMVSPYCASPATPSSVACSSSPGLEEKSFGKSVNIDNDVSNLCGSPSIGSHTQSHHEGYAFNLEKLDSSSILNLGSSLMELLQSDDQSLVDSSFVRSTRLNKLLIWKADISKTLEMTESEIDLLENEMKSMLVSSLIGSPLPEASSSFNEDGKLCSGPVAPSNDVTRPPPLQVVSFEDEMMGKIAGCDVALEENQTGVKNDEIDSPGTATSKFFEPASLKAVSSHDKHEETPTSTNAVLSENVEFKCTIACANDEETTVSCSKGDNLSMENKDDLPPSGKAKLRLDGEDTSFNVILASNKECASKASEVFDKLLPRDFSGVTTVSLSLSDSFFREKFAMRKRFLRFKERVVTLKFKAFQHLWKEDMRLHSIRKYRAKSQKKVELNLRMTNSGYQKHRSTIRSRVSVLGNLASVPTADILDFTSKLLSVSQAKPCRDVLKMPAFILDEEEKTRSRFISHNGLVEDPWAVEKERAMINPWTSEEKEIFMDKLATFGKDFQKIAAFLDHKTTADCVEFYYKNHKSNCFEKIKMGKQSKSSTNYLVPSGKKWNREMNAASLDILGAASVIAADADMRNRQIHSGRMFLVGYSEAKISRNRDVERCSIDNIFGSEKETVAADVLAGICGSVSSEGMSSCITTSVDLGEGYREQRCQNVESASRKRWTADVTQSIDEETCSDESCGEMDPAGWTDVEKSLFIQAVSSYGKDFALISKRVRTRSRDQCKVFFSKARKCLGLDLMQPVCGNIGTPLSDDVNGGGSDTEGACAFETVSASSNDKLGSKMDDNSLLVRSAKEDEFEAGERMNLCCDLNGSEVFNDQKDSKVLENSVSEICQVEQRPDIVDINSKPVIGFCQSESVQAQKVVVDSFGMKGQRDHDAEEGTSSITESRFTDAVNPPDPIVTVELSPTGIGNNIERGFELPQNHLTIRSGLIRDSRTVGTDNHQLLEAGSCTNESHLNDSKHLVTADLASGGKPCNISLPLECNVATVSSELDNSAAIQCRKLHSEDRSSSTLDLEDSREKQAKKFVNRDENFHHLSVRSTVNCDLKAYPMEICIKKEMNGDLSCRPFSEVPNPSDCSTICQLVSQDCYLRKCNSSKVQDTVAEHHLSSHVIDQSIQSNALCWNQSDTSKSCRNGDVKLFGKILTNLSSSQTSNASDHENDENKVLQSKLSSNLGVLKFSGQQNTDDSASLLKFDCGNYIGQDGTPMRSYGFWDGNRIQTGLPCLPDSAVLLAKYPAAFSNFHASSSKIEQQALQAAVNDQNLNGLSVFPSRKMNGSNGVLDYQMYRSHDAPKMPPKMQPISVDMTQKVQPFMVDVKHRQDMISEMQNCNGLEAISSLQQQAKGMVGMNVMGRGMLVAGPCATGVSDPVQAIKLHYTKNDQFSSQNGTIMREDESWRGNGDIGR